MTYTRQQIEEAMEGINSQRQLLGDKLTEITINALQEKLAGIEKNAITAQRKQVTVLFADISDFTAMAEHMDAEEVHGTVNELWERLDMAIINQGGIIDKHLGDAVMAIFGAPIAHEDDPERAVRAALEMQKELAKFVPESSSTSKGVAMRIGIHTGPVLLGTVGLTSEYTAIGDTVNLASRLQYAAPVGDILISYNTYQHIRGVFDVEPVGMVQVKGRSEQVDTYLVHGLKPRAFRVPSRGVEGIETGFFGRDRQFRNLQNILMEVVKKRKSHIVIVIGEAGIGKSRFLYEFVNWIKLIPLEVWFFKGRTYQQMSRVPYSLIRDMFAHRFEILDSDRPPVARQKLESGIVSFAGAEGVKISHFVGRLIGYDFSNSIFLQGILDDSRQIRGLAFRNFSNFFKLVTKSEKEEGLQGGGVAIVVLEDIHWSDDGSLDLITHLVESLPEIPLLIVCAARPSLFDRRPSWGEEWQNSTKFELLPLTKEESRLLVADILRKASSVPVKVIDLIISAAEGNPYYVEELIKMLIDDKVIVKGEKEWKVETKRLEETRVPQTLTGVIQARIDSLTPMERMVLQRASVVGRVFWDNAIEPLLEIVERGSEHQSNERMSTEELNQILKSLESKEMVFKRNETNFHGCQEFIFKHTILHEVTYESVLMRHRHMYHGEIAEWLIEKSGERVNEYAGLIGKHFEQANLEEEAVKWYYRAGEQARETYVPEAAVEYFQRALDLGLDLDNQKVQIGVYRGLGAVLRIQAHYDEAAEVYHAMRALATETGDLVAQAMTWNGLSWVQDFQGRFQDSLESAKHAERFAMEAGAQMELAKALFRKGWAYYRLGDGSAATDLGQQALYLSKELGAQREVANSMSLLGAAYMILGNYSQAVRFHEDALHNFQELGDRDRVGAMFNNLGVTALASGDYKKAFGFFKKSLDIAQEIGNRTSEMNRICNLGGGLVGLNQFQDAEEKLLKAIEMATEVDSWGGMSRTYRYLAESYLGQGKLNKALQCAQEALMRAELMKSTEDVGMAWRVLGMILAQQPEPASITVQQNNRSRICTPQECYRESLSVFIDAKMEAEKARTLRAWAFFELVRGEKKLGEELWQEAMAIFLRLEMQGEVQRMGRPAG